MLYKWKEAVDTKGSEAFPGQGRRTGDKSQASEITRLKRELAKTKEEVEILKRAAAFFAKELLVFPRNNGHTVKLLRPIPQMRPGIYNLTLNAF